jgi:hypothetical protein
MSRRVNTKMRVIKFPHGCHTDPRIISPTTDGILGDISRSMLKHSLKVEEKIWTPPSEYMFISKHMPEEEAEFYIARCESWLEAHPTTAVTEVQQVRSLDMTPLVALLEKYKDKRPPCDEYLEALRTAGASEQRLERARKFYKKMEDTVEKRQEVVDKIFVKYPSAYKPTRTAPVKKVIRAVKKKIVVE